MDRRTFIRTSGAGVVGLAVGTAEAAQAGTQVQAAPAAVPGGRHLRLAMPWAQNGRGFDDSARRLVHWLQTATDDRLRITCLSGVEGLDALAGGRADLYHGPGHDLCRLDPAFAYFSGLPGAAGLRPTYLNSWLMAGGGQALWDDLAAAHGFKPLLAGHAGARAKLWSRDPVRDAGDLEGRRIAAVGPAADVVRKLGGEPVDVAPADLGSALGEGRIDAVEWGGTIAAYGCDLHRSARFCLRPGLTRTGFATVLAVRSDVWRDLGTAERTVLAAGAAQELNTVVAESRAASRHLRLALGAQMGLAFETMPAAVADATLKAAAAVVAHTANNSPDAERIHASYTAFRAGLPAVRRRAAPVA